MNASLDHLLSVLGLWALDDGLALLQGDLLLQGVLVVEADRLIEGHGLLILVLQLVVHALVLETIVAHLVETCVFLGTGSFLVGTVSEAVECSLELFPADFTVLIGVKLSNEYVDFIF